MGSLILHKHLSETTNTHRRVKLQVGHPLPQAHSSSNHTYCPQFLPTPAACGRGRWFLQAPGSGAENPEGCFCKAVLSHHALIWGGVGGGGGTCVSGTVVASVELAEDVVCAELGAQGHAAQVIVNAHVRA